MAVVGDRELEGGTLNIRRREGGEQLSVTVDEFLNRLADEAKLPI
jgi:threonyl-tRNA synthetase